MNQKHKQEKIRTAKEFIKYSNKLYTPHVFALPECFFLFVRLAFYAIRGQASVVYKTKRKRILTKDTKFST
jgi:hypothetical protein